jgi:hypothetical protein
VAQAVRVHDPAKVVLDLAVALVLGDCLADIALLREQPGVFGRCPRGTPRRRWPQSSLHGGRLAQWHGGPPAVTLRIVIGMRQPLVIDLDAALVTAHSQRDGQGACGVSGWQTTVAPYYIQTGEEWRGIRRVGQLRSLRPGYGSGY